MDLRGQRFGRLTVTDMPEPTAAGKHPRWPCRCDCGKETEVIGSRLRNGITRSCGCLSRELASERTKGKPAQRDSRCFPGAVFGRLTLQAVEGRSDDGRALWRCACECGGTSLVPNKNLLSGGTKSCGCLRREALVPFTASKYPQPYAGAVYGKLTAVEAVGYTKDKKRLWRCACECGGTKDVAASNLTAGNVKSCGCLVKGAALRKAGLTVTPARTFPTVTRSASNSHLFPPAAPLKKPGKPHKDLGPWFARASSGDITPPAQRDPRATVCPSPGHDVRYQLPEGERVLGGFATMGIGRYLEVAA
jgi:hypothetical protein